ncbi:phospholipase A [Sulfurimonas sp.]|uniref:phospholipase A n=1 Tax=Sulfurimonas sp. TaxID=2022749 RepID=UPI003563DDC5
MRYIFILLFLYTALFSAETSSRKGKELDKYEVSEIEDVEAKKGMQKWLNRDFGLKPHKVNYILPYAYREGVYKSYVPTDEYRNIEAELQVSLKLYLGTGLFGLNESYYLAYSHQAFWQIYSDSSPFRETNYNPEGFVEFPILDKDSLLNMKSIKFGLAHTSNGQGSNTNVVYANPADNPGNRSRSLNYMYSEFAFQHDTLLTEFTLISPFPGTADDLDNPDIMDYLGYTSVKLNYFTAKHMFTLMGRGNFTTGYGAVESTYSYPLIDDAYFFMKIFSGYGESLIDYDNYITKFSLGFSFSR